MTESMENEMRMAQLLNEYRQGHDISDGTLYRRIWGKSADHAIWYSSFTGSEVDVIRESSKPFSFPSRFFSTQDIELSLYEVQA